MNITDYKNELILIFAILFMELVASKKSERINLGENKSGNLLLEFYDNKKAKKVFVFENGLIRQ